MALSAISTKSTKPIVGPIVHNNQKRTYTPANLITPLWYDFSDSSTVSLTGSLIDSIANKGTASSANLLGVTTTRPTLSSSAINSLDAATFNNTHYMQTAALLAIVNQPITWGIVWITDTVPPASNDGFLFDVYSSTTDRNFLRVATDSDLDANGGSTVALLDTTPAAAVNVATVTYSGATSRALVNGADIGTVDLGTKGFKGLTLGNNFAKNAGHVGKIGEVFAVNQNLSELQLGDLHNYLGSKWVTSWLPISL